MTTIALLFALQDLLTDGARRALGDGYAGLQRVEIQVRDSIAELSALRTRAVDARKRADAAALARLTDEAERLNRRYLAERQEFSLRTRKLAARIEEALRASPDAPDLLRARLHLAEHVTLAGEAARCLQDVAKLPEDESTRVSRAICLRQLGKLGEAQPLLAEPKSDRARAYAGLVAYDLSDAEAARRLLAAADASKLRPFLAARVAAVLQEDAIRAHERERDDLPRLELATPSGRIVLELFEDDAPNTVANFVELVEKKFYDGTRFHRVEPNFVVQGGDPNSRNDTRADDGQGGPGYALRDEFGPGYRRHFRGTLSMANSGPHTGGSQFFITHRQTEHLDGRHTVFGRVLEGLEVIDRIRAGEPISFVRVLRQRPHEYRVQKE